MEPDEFGSRVGHLEICRPRAGSAESSDNRLQTLCCNGSDSPKQIYDAILASRLNNLKVAAAIKLRVF
jgi:hypothetical protein